MLVHTVFFWLRKDLSDAQVAAFKAALESLKSIESAEAVYTGSPAPTPERPVIDASYDYCLTVLLKDLAAHDRYQADPLHQRFLEENRALWDAVRIYDAA